MEFIDSWLSMKTLFPQTLLSKQNKKPTQTIFVMTKVYIFAIAQFFSLSQILLKKIEKNSLPKKEKSKKHLKKRGRRTKLEYCDTFLS